jgi:hypothetical protein
MTTTDLSQFGYRELREVKDILVAWLDGSGLPEDFYEDEVTFMFNQNSGNVFLTNSEYQVAMLYGNKLESFYSSPYKGLEGFFIELLDEYEYMHHEDKEWFEELAKSLDREDELPKDEEEE